MGFEGAKNNGKGEREGSEKQRGISRGHRGGGSRTTGGEGIKIHADEETVQNENISIIPLSEENRKKVARYLDNLKPGTTPAFGSAMSKIFDSAGLSVVRQAVKDGESYTIRDRGGVVLESVTIDTVVNILRTLADTEPESPETTPVTHTENTDQETRFVSFIEFKIPSLSKKEKGSVRQLLGRLVHANGDFVFRETEKTMLTGMGISYLSIPDDGTQQYRFLNDDGEIAVVQKNDLGSFFSRVAGIKEKPEKKEKKTEAPVPVAASPEPDPFRFPTSADHPERKPDPAIPGEPPASGVPEDPPAPTITESPETEITPAFFDTFKEYFPEARVFGNTVRYKGPEGSVTASFSYAETLLKSAQKQLLERLNVIHPEATIEKDGTFTVLHEDMAIPYGPGEVRTLLDEMGVEAPSLESTPSARKGTNPETNEAELNLNPREQRVYDAVKEQYADAYFFRTRKGTLYWVVTDEDGTYQTPRSVRETEKMFFGEDTLEQEDLEALAYDLQGTFPDSEVYWDPEDVSFHVVSASGGHNVLSKQEAVERLHEHESNIPVLTEIEDPQSLKLVNDLRGYFDEVSLDDKGNIIVKIRGEERVLTQKLAQGVLANAQKVERTRRENLFANPPEIQLDRNNALFQILEKYRTENEITDELAEDVWRRWQVSLRDMRREDVILWITNKMDELQRESTLITESLQYETDASEETRQFIVNFRNHYPSALLQRENLVGYYDKDGRWVTATYAEAGRILARKERSGIGDINVHGEVESGRKASSDTREGVDNTEDIPSRSRGAGGGRTIGRNRQGELTPTEAPLPGVEDGSLSEEEQKLYDRVKIVFPNAVLYKNGDKTWVILDPKETSPRHESLIEAQTAVREQEKAERLQIKRIDNTIDFLKKLTTGEIDYRSEAFKKFATDHFSADEAYGEKILDRLARQSNGDAEAYFQMWAQEKIGTLKQERKELRGRIGAIERREAGSVTEFFDPRFEEQFGIKKEDLESIPGYNQLNQGQRVLLYQNLDEYAQQGNGALGRFWKGMMSHTFGTEGNTVPKKGTKGIDAYRDQVALMITATSGLKVHVENGNAIPDFVGVGAIDRRSREVQWRAIAHLNELAHAFSKVPASWQQDGIGVHSSNSEEGAGGWGGIGSFLKEKVPGIRSKSRMQYREYQEMALDYENAKKEFAEVMLGGGMSNEEVVRTLLNVDNLVHMQRFIETNPEAVEKLMHDIDPKTAETIGEKWSYRLGYGALGFGSRMLTAGALGLLAGPAIAVARAGIVSWNKTAALQRERDRQLMLGKSEDEKEFNRLKMQEKVAYARDVTAHAQKESQRRGRSTPIPFELSEETKEARAALRKFESQRALLNVVSARSLVGRGEEKVDRGMIAKLEEVREKYEALQASRDGDTRVTRFEGDQEVSHTKRELARQSLLARIQYAEDKFRLNRIRFGEGAAYAENRASFIGALARAKIVVANKELDGLSIGRTKKDRLASLLNRREDTMAYVRNKEQWRESLTGKELRKAALWSGVGVVGGELVDRYKEELKEAGGKVIDWFSGSQDEGTPNGGNREAATANTPVGGSGEVERNQALAKMEAEARSGSTSNENAVAGSEVAYNQELRPYTVQVKDEMALIVRNNKLLSGEVLNNDALLEKKLRSLSPKDWKLVGVESGDFTKIKPGEQVNLEILGKMLNDPFPSTPERALPSNAAFTYNSQAESTKLVVEPPQSQAPMENVGRAVNGSFETVVAPRHEFVFSGQGLPQTRLGIERFPNGTFAMEINQQPLTMEVQQVSRDGRVLLGGIDAGGRRYIFELPSPKDIAAGKPGLFNPGIPFGVKYEVGLQGKILGEMPSEKMAPIEEGRNTRIVEQIQPGQRPDVVTQASSGGTEQPRDGRTVNEYLFRSRAPEPPTESPLLEERINTRLEKEVSDWLFGRSGSQPSSPQAVSGPRVSPGAERELSNWLFPKGVPEALSYLGVPGTPLTLTSTELTGNSPIHLKAQNRALGDFSLQINSLGAKPDIEINGRKVMDPLVLSSYKDDFKSIEFTFNGSKHAIVYVPKQATLSHFAGGVGSNLAR